MIDVILARDERMTVTGGRWFGNYETPSILSRVGRQKVASELDTSSYGRKESEGRDYNEDTNFGKLKRIPYPPLQEFLKVHGKATITSPDETESEVAEVEEPEADPLETLGEG